MQIQELTSKLMGHTGKCLEIIGEIASSDLQSYVDVMKAQDINHYVLSKSYDLSGSTFNKTTTLVKAYDTNNVYNIDLSLESYEQMSEAIEDELMFQLFIDDCGFKFVSSYEL